MKFPKHQTVSWWIKQLQQYPDEYLVMLADGPGSEYSCFLSDYLLSKKINGKQCGFVCIDIGPPEMDE